MTEQLHLIESLAWLKVEGEIVALDIDRSLYLGANETAARLWRELDAGTTKERLVESLVEAYGIDPDAAERDVTSFLDQLAAEGYLRSGPPETPGMRTRLAAGQVLPSDG